MSRIETAPPVFCFDFDCSSTFTTFIRSRLSCWTTSSRLAASIVAVLSSPLASRAVYVYVGIVYSSNGVMLCRGSIFHLRSPLASARRRRTLRPRLRRRIALDHRLADQPIELGRIARHPQALLLVHLACHVQLVQRVVHRLHAVLFSGLHRRIDLVNFV